MANWAIVIGINQYWKPEACLKGAINDARKMCEWLLRVDGGAVPPRNLYLLLTDPVVDSLCWDSPFLIDPFLACPL